MKRILLAMILLFSTSMADSVLLVKKGWQLIGSATPLKDMSKFQSDSVEQVWHFDATTQKWLGYSPDSQTQSKMSAKGISKLHNLENWHGFWVKSKKEWSLTLPNTTLSKAPSDENSSNDIIQLKKGWNLISLPVDAVLSADIFKDMTVWKYNPNREWEIFDKGETPVEDFPKLAHIKNSDGLWVKADKDTDISAMKEASKLHNFKTSTEMEAYIKSTIQIHQRPVCGFEPIFMTRGGVVNDAVPAPMVTMADSTFENADTGAKNASSTNLQEQDVDEADIVKHDGTNIFYTQKENNMDSYRQSYVNITSFAQLAKSKGKPINQISLKNKHQDISSLYLVNKKLIVLSNLNSYTRDEIKEVEGQEILGHATQHIVVDIFDVSDIKNIKKVSRHQVDGNMVTSRVVGDNLYLISNFSPRYNISYPKEYVTLSDECKEFFTPQEDEDTPDRPYPIEVTVSSSEQTPPPPSEPKVSPSRKSQPYNPGQYNECYALNHEKDTDKYYRYDYENPIIKIIDLTPNIEGSALVRQELIEPNKFYTSSKQDQNSNMTTISTINISDGAYKNSNSFMGYSSTQYASSKALYLVSNQYPIYYDFNNYKERSSVYKFNLDDTLDYRGIGSVYGKPLNQFALSEHKDILRIATTEGFSWGSRGTNNSIYTLKEDNGLLPIEGVLSGLGKEGETIKSVRFMGDRGYVVTFKQTDPLYTIDMSDPKAPKKMGELEVSGYSAYLHPVGDDKLLGIGRDADSEGRVQGVKIELFDISDFENPSSLDSIILRRDTYSQLERNHKALAYRQSDNLFAFPYRENGDHTNDYKNHNYLGVYQIKDDELVTHQRVSSSISSWGESRGLIFDMHDKTFISFFNNGEITTEKLEEK